MTVTVEAEIEAQRGEVIVLRKEVERSSQSELHLVPVQRHAFDLLKDLSEVTGEWPTSAPISARVQRRVRSLANTSLVRLTSLCRTAVAVGVCAVRGPSARVASVRARLSASSGSACSCGDCAEAAPQAPALSDRCANVVVERRRLRFHAAGFGATVHRVSVR